MADHIATACPMSDSHRRFAKSCLLLALGAALAACSSFDNLSNNVAGVVKPYKMDIVQGNVVTKEQADALKPGMTRVQVRDLLGTALLASMFHADRWDYVFTFKRQGVPSQARRVTVYFKGDVLDRFEADPLPTEAEFVATLDSGRIKVNKNSKRSLEASEEDLKKFPVATKLSDQDKPLPPLPANYPPLEPAAGR
jgi:outer membrane protein assembly factor BamE